MNFVDFAVFLGTTIGVLAAIAGLWTFVAKDGASVRMKVSVLGGIEVVVLVVGVIVWTDPEGEVEAEPTGQVVSPASGETVGRKIQARGVLADIPDDQHVWLVVRDGNLLYPQDTEITPPEGEWSLRFHQGGTTNVISLELDRMNDTGNSFIADRLDAADYSGFPKIPGAVRLDIVENLRIRGSSTAPRAAPTPAEPTGQIVSPASGASVGRDISARGVLAHIPEDQHVWLVVRDGNLLYPQDSEVTPPDGEWLLSFTQGGAARSISLGLYRVSEEGNRFINERLNARNFAGISRIPGAKPLDAVENVRIGG